MAGIPGPPPQPVRRRGQDLIPAPRRPRLEFSGRIPPVARIPSGAETYDRHHALPMGLRPVCLPPPLTHCHEIVFATEKVGARRYKLGKVAYIIQYPCLAPLGATACMAFFRVFLPRPPLPTPDPTQFGTAQKQVAQSAQIGFAQFPRDFNKPRHVTEST